MIGSPEHFGSRKRSSFLLQYDVRQYPRQFDPSYGRPACYDACVLAGVKVRRNEEHVRRGDGRSRALLAVLAAMARSQAADAGAKETKWYKHNFWQSDARARGRLTGAANRPR